MHNIHTIFGAPGCGKTTRLMKILEQELRMNDPSRIAFVSFTRKGTYEGVNRAREMFNYAESDLPHFRTLHSLAFRTGGYSRADMVSKKDYKVFSDAMGMKFVGYYSADFYNSDDRYLFLVDLEHNNPAMYQRYLQDVNMLTLESVKSNFVEFKKIMRIVDFTDIIEEFLRRDKPLPVDVAIIDEAQDLTTLQWRMCELAFRDCKRVYVAGDDDQAIYEWSGADVEQFLALPGEREVLSRSYRLQKRVLELAQTVSTMISHRVPKDFAPMGDEGCIKFYNDISEVEVTPGETYYFLSRNNCFLPMYADALKRRALVFTIKDDLSYDPREVAAINAFEKARRQGKMSDAEEMRLRAYLRPGHDMTRPWFDNLLIENDAVSYYKDLIRTKADMGNRLLHVDTIHGVKGGEADNVVLMLDFTRAVRNNFENNPDAELRCLYVACTRAKKNLHIVHSSTRNGYDSYVRMEAI